MLDLRMIRRDPERVRRALARRGDDVPIDQLLEKDEQWRSALAEVEKPHRTAVNAAHPGGVLRAALQLAPNAWRPVP